MGKKTDKLRQQVRELRRQMSAQYAVTREHAQRLRKLELAAGNSPTHREYLLTTPLYRLASDAYKKTMMEHAEAMDREIAAANTAAHQGDEQQRPQPWVYTASGASDPED
jgi:hypothetical protein